MAELQVLEENPYLYSLAFHNINTPTPFSLQFTLAKSHERFQNFKKPMESLGVVRTTRELLLAFIEQDQDFRHFI